MLDGRVGLKSGDAIDAAGHNENEGVNPGHPFHANRNCLL